MGAADHRDNLTGRRLERDQRSFVRADAFGPGGVYAPIHCLLRDFFHLRIERRVDLQTALVCRRFTKRAFEAVHHIRREPRIAIALQTRRA